MSVDPSIRRPTVRAGMRAGGWPTALTAIYVVGFCVWLAAGWGGPANAAAISDAAFLPMSLAAAVLSWRATRRPGIGPRRIRAWRLISVSYLCYWAGDMGWFYFDAVRGTRPYPSLADIGYLSFYPFLAAGLLSLPAMRRGARDRAVLGLDAATVTIGSFLVIWYLIIGPTIRADSAAASGWLTSTLDVAYPLGDTLVVFALAVVLVRTTAKRDPPLVALSFGLVIFVVADILYSRMSLDGMYRDGSWINALWMVGQGHTIVSAHLASRTGLLERRSGSVAPLGVGVSRLPFLAIAGALVLLIVVSAQQSSARILELVAGVVALAAVVTLRHLTVLQENRRLVTALRHVAHTDHLTGIGNRAQFFVAAEASFESSRSDEHPLGLMMIDVDHFKAVNDTYGHATGDTILREVARRVCAAVRERDLVARYGGDELVVLLPGCAESTLCEVADRIVQVVRSTPMSCDSLAIEVTVSIGAARSENTTTLIETLDRADRALYEAKRAGRDGWSMHREPSQAVQLLAEAYGFIRAADHKESGTTATKAPFSHRYRVPEVGLEVRRERAVTDAVTIAGDDIPFLALSAPPPVVVTLEAPLDTPYGDRRAMVRDF